MLFSVTEHFTKTARHASFNLASGCETGPLIIFIHGWPELSHSWRHQLRCFAALSFLRRPGHARLWPFLQWGGTLPALAGISCRRTPGSSRTGIVMLGPVTPAQSAEALIEVPFPPFRSPISPATKVCAATSPVNGSIRRQSRHFATSAPRSGAVWPSFRSGRLTRIGPN